MYGCESWTVKKAEHRRIDAFELWCWRRLLRVPWTARRSNQSILKEISPGCSLEGMMLKLKLQYFGHLMKRVDSLEKTLMLGGPHRWQPTRLPHPWDSPGTNTGVGCHFLLQCTKVKMKSLSCVQLFATPQTAAYQAPLSMGFSRQEHWSGLPFPSPIQ